MPSTDSTRSTSIALAVGVLAVGCLAELLRVSLRVLTRSSGIGALQGQLLTEIAPTAVLATGPLVVVFGLCRHTRVQSLTTSEIGSIALVSGVVGRYLGLTLGSVGRNGQIPSPTGLVTSADFVLSLEVPGLVLIVILGLVSTGFWSLIGTFGGIGLATLVTGTDTIGVEN